MKDFDWKGLAEALTYAHCEAQGIEVTRSSVTGNGGSPVKTPLEVVHITPIDASNSVAAESLPTAHAHTCGPQGQSAEFGNGADSAGSAPEILTAHCHRVSGLTLVERIEATLNPLQVQRLDFEMRARRIDNFSVSDSRDPAEDPRFA